MKREPSITLRELRAELTQLARRIRTAGPLDCGTYRDGQADAIEMIRELIVEPREKAARKTARRRAVR